MDCGERKALDELGVDLGGDEGVFGEERAAVDEAVADDVDTDAERGELREDGLDGDGVRRDDGHRLVAEGRAAVGRRPAVQRVLDEGRLSRLGADAVRLARHRRHERARTPALARVHLARQRRAPAVAHKKSKLFVRHFLKVKKQEQQETSVQTIFSKKKKHNAQEKGREKKTKTRK